MDKKQQLIDCIVEMGKDIEVKELENFLLYRPDLILSELSEYHLGERSGINTADR